MARPKKSPAQKAKDAQEARTSIVRAAAAVVAALGVRALTVENILEAAQVSRRTFYRYFDSKDDLLVALFEASAHELIAIMQDALTGPDALAALRAGLDAYLDFHVDGGALLRVLIEEAIRTDSKLAPLRAGFQDALVSVLDAAVQHRYGRCVDPLAFVLLVGGVEAVSLRLLQRGAGPGEVERAKATLHGVLHATLGPGGIACLPDAAPG